MMSRWCHCGVVWCHGSQITWTQDSDAILLSAGRHAKPDGKNHPNDPSKSLVFSFVRGPTFPIIPFDKLERRSRDHLFIMRSVDLEEQWGSAVVHCGKCRTQCFRALGFDLWPIWAWAAPIRPFPLFFRFFSPSTWRGSFAFLAASECSIFPSFFRLEPRASPGPPRPARLARPAQPAADVIIQYFSRYFFEKKKEKKLLG